MEEPAKVTRIVTDANGTVSIFCPRCDREKSGLTFVSAWAALRAHVEVNHPEYDPLWHEADKFPPAATTE